jgi:hypothetical protein
MQEPGAKAQRFDVTYFDGVNAAVQRMLAKRQEFSHAENARTGSIGSIEKRGGQAKYGTAAGGWFFMASENYELTKFLNDGPNQGLFRISTSSEPVAAFSMSVYENVYVFDLYNPTTSALYIKSSENVTVSEPAIFSRADANTVILDGTSQLATIWTLNPANIWTALTDPDATNIIGAQFDSVPFDTNLLLVNQRDYNRYIKSDGTTVIDSTQAGSLFNSPRASRCAYYKGRIYLADIMRAGIRYKTTVARSSFASGILSLVNGDSVSHVSGTTLDVTDVKYFYSDSGMNTYDVYRGVTLITTLTVTAINSTSITVTHSGTPTLNTADEIWISGTYNGEKQYRWMNNASMGGQDVKQYDTFKLAGGTEDAITLLEPVGNILMVSNRNAFLTWNDYSLQTFDQGVGCVSQNGYAKLLGSLYFLHYSGIYSTNGSTPTLLSRKVSKYIQGTTRSALENAACAYKGLSVFFAIGDSTLYKNDGSFWKTLPDVCLEYNVVDQNWFVHTNVPAKQLLNFISADGAERLLMEHKGSGKNIKEFLVGSDDDGASIFFRADLPPIQLMKEVEVYANPIAVSAESERGSLIRCFASVDGNDFYELQGDLLKGVSTIKVTAPDSDSEEPVLCHWIQLSFREGSPQICRLVQASIIYLPTTITQPR